nr:hypothetical protein [Halolactibacillus sp. JCM 19043]
MKKELANTLNQAMFSLLSNKNVLSVKMDGTTGMTKREQELRQSVADLKDEAQELQDEGKYEEAKAKIEEAKAAKKDLDNFLALQKDFHGLTVTEPQANGSQMPGEPKQDDKKEYKQVFFKLYVAIN